jgi:hypothetical protein
MNRNEWDGRAVTFAEFSIRQGREVRDAFAVDGENASYLCLALSMRYADSNELVFKSVDEVWQQPHKLQQRVFLLAREAMKVNAMLGEEPADGPKPNGHDAETPGPSP